MFQYIKIQEFKPMELLLMPLCYIWNRTKKELTASTGDGIYPTNPKLKGQFNLSLLLEIFSNSWF